MVEKFFKTSIRTIYSDGGKDYQGLKIMFAYSGIQHLISPPYTPQHFASTERRHRHIVETTLTLLHHASIPLKYWTLAFQAAVYLINRMPSPVTRNKSPYFHLFKQSPNYLSLKIFGCLCYPWLRPYASHKLEPRSRPCVFVGYSIPHHAYLCLDPSTNKIFTSRHVIFVENSFPFQNQTFHNESPFLIPSLDTWLPKPPHEFSKFSFPISSLDIIPNSSPLTSDTQHISNLPISPTLQAKNVSFSPYGNSTNSRGESPSYRSNSLHQATSSSISSPLP